MDEKDKSEDPWKFVFHILTFQVKPWKLNDRTQNTWGAPNGPIRKYSAIHEYSRRPNEAAFSHSAEAEGVAVSFQKNSSMINTYGL